MQGPAATENPSHSLSSLLGSFTSVHCHEEVEDDNSQLPNEESQAEEAPPQTAQEPNAFSSGEKPKATLTSVGGESASKTGRSEEIDLNFSEL